MTLNQLRRLVKLWQKRLRVSDWAITVRRDKLKEEYGNTWYDPRGMMATLTIAEDMNDPNYEDGGIEQTVIHELLHIVLHGDKDYEGEVVMQERAINQIADALYRAYRRGKRG